MPTPCERPFSAPVMVAALLLGAVSGCFTWRTPENPWQAQLSSGESSSLRVTVREGARISLASPVLSNDTVFGYVSRREGRESAYFVAEEGRRARLGIPATDVTSVEVLKLDVGKTVLVVAAGIGVTVFLVAANNCCAPFEGSEGSTTSCPFIYSWDGVDWRFESGTFGGAFLEPLSRTDVDVLEHASESDEMLRLRLTNELAETDHVDEVAVEAIDHPRGMILAPSGDGSLHAFGTLIEPTGARDRSGRDVLARVRAADDWRWESSLVERDPTDDTQLRDGIELVFPRSTSSADARLLVDAHNTPWAAHLLQRFVRWHGRTTDAWYDSLNADPDRAARLGRKMAEEAFLHVSVLTEDGWVEQGSVWEASPELGKRHAVALDLSRVRGESVRVRLTSPPSFWLIDRVAADFGPETALSTQRLELGQAIQERGGDVRAELSALDGRRLTLQPGDRVELMYRVPPVASGLGRTYVVLSSGWYRIHGPSAGEPQSGVLRQLEEEPGSIARLSVGWMNEALRSQAAAISW